MTEDHFQLTPHEVRTQEFQKELRGYDRQQVDDFKQRLSDELERLLRERVQMEERVKAGQEQLRAFRDRERALNEALIAAQQLREDTRVQANHEAELILREARTEALRIVGQAQVDEQGLRERFEALHRQFAVYLANFRALLERHLGEVEGYQVHSQVMHQVQTELLLKRQS
jgi:DivIVA domain-containing protein